MLKMKDVPASSWRPTISGSHYAVSTGHALASAAAMRILDRRGNAIDAGVTAAMALAILQPDIVSFAGVAPTLIYLKAENRVVSLAGLGWWPAATDVERLRAEGAGEMPEGILRQVIPAAPATHLLALEEFGTISFEAAAQAAFELARDGFAMYPILFESLDLRGRKIDRYEENAAIFRPGGVTPPVGSRLRQSHLATTIGRMINAERNAPGDRRAKLRAVHDFFYKGEIAREIDAFHRRKGGFMRADDLAAFEVPVEGTIHCDYRGYQVHSCDVWCQGIVLLESLRLLDGLDVVALNHNSAPYLHTLAQTLNLSFADREAYVGDPRFVSVPTAQLLSETYAAQQRGRLDPRHAQTEMPQAGTFDMGTSGPASMSMHRPCIGSVPSSLDTIYACVFDAAGNGYSATLSDTMYDSPMVDGTGLSVSSRGSQGRLEPNHPAFVIPGKRPRLTPTPALALRDGELAMAWGTPGGDVQCQAMLQVFLNATQFGMSMQRAIEAPRMATFNFPDSFAPHAYYPGRLCVEQRIAPDTIATLRGLGYDVELWSDIAFPAGAVCAIIRDAKSGLLHAGADPRRAAYAMAW